MNTEQIRGLFPSARVSGDLLLEAACCSLLAGYAPYRLWAALTTQQRADVGRVSDELSRLTSVEAIALSDLTKSRPASRRQSERR